MRATRWGVFGALAVLTACAGDDVSFGAGGAGGSAGDGGASASVVANSSSVTSSSAGGAGEGGVGGAAGGEGGTLAAGGAGGLGGVGGMGGTGPLCDTPACGFLVGSANCDPQCNWPIHASCSDVCAAPSAPYHQLPMGASHVRLQPVAVPLPGCAAACPGGPWLTYMARLSSSAGCLVIDGPESLRVRIVDNPGQPPDLPCDMPAPNDIAQCHNGMVDETTLVRWIVMGIVDNGGTMPDSGVIVRVQLDPVSCIAPHCNGGCSGEEQFP